MILAEQLLKWRNFIVLTVRDIKILKVNYHKLLKLVKQNLKEAHLNYLSDYQWPHIYKFI